VTLWPSDENWPVGGEVDYAEVFDSSRQQLRFFLHYGAANTVIGGYRRIDMTQWHNYAVEWAPDHMTGYVDGQVFFHTTNRSALPPGRMHQTIQLDWFPGDGKGGAVLDVDWARKYGL
jgi:beta-glucanase (GH16 family)